MPPLDGPKRIEIRQTGVSSGHELDFKEDNGKGLSLYAKPSRLTYLDVFRLQQALLGLKVVFDQSVWPFSILSRITS